MTVAPPVPTLERAFDVDASLGPMEDHGMTRAGHRRVVPISSGTVTGLFEASILPGGADWQVVRPDGTVEVDTRYSARTADGEFVHFRTSGVRTGPPEVIAVFVASAVREAARVYYSAYRVT